MKRLLILTLLTCILFSGCISSENDTGTYNGDIEDLLIEQADLPEGYFPEPIVFDRTNSSEILPEYGYVDDVNAYFKITIKSEDSVTETILGQNVMQFDKEKAADYLTYIFSVVEEWYSNGANENIEDWTSTFELYEHETIGEESRVAIATMKKDGLPDSTLNSRQSYYVIFVKKNIVVNIQGDDTDERMGIEELIDLARDIEQRI